jgi:hypothetical protein
MCRAGCPNAAGTWDVQELPGMRRTGRAPLAVALPGCEAADYFTTFEETFELALSVPLLV